MADTQTYNAATDTLTGDRVHIFLDTDLASKDVSEVDFTTINPVAYGTSCSIEITADTIDAANKMGGNWKNTRVGQLSWTASVEALYSKVNTHLSFNKCKVAFANRQAIGIALGVVAEDEAGFEAARKNGFLLDETDYVIAKGKAYITSCTANFGTGGEIISFNMTLTGDGPLLMSETMTAKPETAETESAS